MSDKEWSDIGSVEEEVFAGSLLREADDRVDL